MKNSKSKLKSSVPRVFQSNSMCITVNVRLESEVDGRFGLLGYLKVELCDKHMGRAKRSSDIIAIRTTANYEALIKGGLFLCFRKITA
jgi:hypothetical protein